MGEEIKSEETEEAVAAEESGRTAEENTEETDEMKN